MRGLRCVLRGSATPPYAPCYGDLVHARLSAGHGAVGGAR